jgi:hypothetical protein
MDLFRSVEEFDGNESAGFVVIEYHSRPRFVALDDLAIAEDDRQGIRLFVENHFHETLQYLDTWLVL